MFQQEGLGRSDRQNRIIAGYLAFWAGFVNSAGFVLIGSFTSHVTGNVGRFANDLTTGEVGAAAAALTMIVAFFVGAFVASMAIESNFFGRTANAYGAALIAESTVLLLFSAATRLTPQAHPRLHDMEAALLCAAMGMQNSLVTRLSGAVVRTTHLTGVLTDLGIEGARWFRWWRGSAAKVFRMRLAFGRKVAEKPSGPKAALLGTIALAFTVGAAGGATAAITFRQLAIVVAAVAVAGSGAYAFVNGRRRPEPAPDTRK